MSKKKNKSNSCCCCCEMKKVDDCCCCCGNNNTSGGNCGCTPIIFLLIACGSGLLNCSKSYLIILLCLLCGGNFTSLLGGCNRNNQCC